MDKLKAVVRNAEEAPHPNALRRIKKKSHAKASRTAGVISLVLFIALTASSDEWKSSHGLVSVTGVMNLTEPPPPSEVFFSGPDSAAQTALWLEGLNAWRADRRVRLRYQDAQYERADLAWTQ